MRSSVSKSAWEGATGFAKSVYDPQNTTQAKTHRYVGLLLTFIQP
jgi:hypothetical protein